MGSPSMIQPLRGRDKPQWLIEGEHTSAGLQRKLRDNFTNTGMNLWQENGDRRLRGIDQGAWEDAEHQRTSDHQDERCC
jgi:hypothetical protein